MTTWTRAALSIASDTYQRIFNDRRELAGRARGPAFAQAVAEGARARRSATPSSAGPTRCARAPTPGRSPTCPARRSAA